MPITLTVESNENKTVLKNLNPGETLSLKLPDDGRFFIIKLNCSSPTFYNVQLNLTSERTASVQYRLYRKYKRYDEQKKIVYEYTDSILLDSLSVSNESKAISLNFTKQKDDRYFLEIKYVDSEKASLKITLEAYEVSNIGIGSSKTLYNQTGKVFVYKVNLKASEAYNVSLESNLTIIKKALIIVEFSDLNDDDVVSVYAYNYKTHSYVFLSNVTNLPYYTTTVSLKMPMECLNLAYDSYSLSVEAQLKFELVNGTDRFVVVDEAELYVYLINGEYLYSHYYVWGYLTYIGDSTYAYFYDYYWDEIPVVASYTILINGYKYIEKDLVLQNISDILPILNDSETIIVISISRYAVNSYIALKVDYYKGKFVILEPGEKETVTFSKEEDFILAYIVDFFKVYTIRGKIINGDYWSVSGGLFSYMKLGEFEKIYYLEKFFLVPNYYYYQHSYPVYEISYTLYGRSFLFDSEGNFEYYVPPSGILTGSYYEGIPVPKLWLYGSVEKIEGGTSNITVEILLEELTLNEISEKQATLSFNTTIPNRDITSVTDINLYKISAEIGDSILLKIQSSASLGLVPGAYIGYSTYYAYTENSITNYYFLNIEEGWYLIAYSSSSNVYIEINKLAKEKLENSMTFNVTGYLYLAFDASEVPPGSEIKIKVLRGNIELSITLIENNKKVIFENYYSIGKGSEIRVPTSLTSSSESTLIVKGNGIGEILITYEITVPIEQQTNNSRLLGIGIGLAVGIGALIIIGIIIRRRL